MNCSEAEIYVSAACDGETVPREYAAHIAGCKQCRSTLAEYSQMGAELRLLSLSDAGAVLPPLAIPGRRSRWAFLWKRVLVPRFAMIAALVAAALAVATSSVVRAQSHPLWFEFGYSPSRDRPLNYLAGREGLDQTGASGLYFQAGNPMAVALRIKIENISTTRVILRARAVPARIQPTPAGYRLLGGPPGGISLAGVPTVIYKPGASLALPIEGGGTLYLTGEVLDHQPEIAFGMPLEPLANRMNVRSPALIEGDRLLGQIEGAGASANAPREAIFFHTRDRVFAFSLQPFAGAVKGEANWGQVSFKWDAARYTLLAAAPVSGGDQPRTIWVRTAEHPAWGPHCEETCLSAGPVPK